jgi:hypothetical protein
MSFFEILVRFNVRTGLLATLVAWDFISVLTTKPSHQKRAA